MLHCGLNLTSDFKPFISNHGINNFFFFFFFYCCRIFSFSKQGEIFFLSVLLLLNHVCFGKAWCEGNLI